MNLQESIRRIVKEVRVPRNERVELYKDNNIIVVVPLTHRALKKYANQCQWCINSDLDEWEDHHKGKHAVIIQRNPKKPKMGITGHPTASEIFFLAKWDNGQSDFDDICQILDYEFRNDRTMADYYTTISNDINNFGTNIVYYSPENGVYDQEDNFLWNFNYEISDIPNVTPEVIKIMDNYLQEEEEMNLQESIKRILREELNESTFFRRRINLDEVRKLLSVNAKQIFHETESFGQFKYELTLRAVESIMWDEYNIGWEDLPEQEEIDFVTEVADMFEDIIIDLYKHIRGKL